VSVERWAVDDFSRLSRAFLVTTTKVFHFPQQMILATELAEMLDRLLCLDTRPVADNAIIMAALCNRAGHYIFVLWFLFSSFFFFVA